MNGTGSGDMAVKPAKPSATEAVLSEFKLKLERRVGHQLWQVSEAVRKIVQAMTLLQQHCGLRMDAAPASRVSKAAGPGASDAGCTANAASDPRWSVARLTQMFTFFRAKQLGFPAARWGGAVGVIGFFLLYEDLPQLIMQTQYGVFPGWDGVAREFGLMAKKTEEE